MEVLLQFDKVVERYQVWDDCLNDLDKVKKFVHDYTDDLPSGISTNTLNEVITLLKQAEEKIHDHITLD